MRIRNKQSQLRLLITYRQEWPVYGRDITVRSQELYVDHGTELRVIGHCDEHFNLVDAILLNARNRVRCGLKGNENRIISAWQVFYQYFGFPTQKKTCLRM